MGAGCKTFTYDIDTSAAGTTMSFSQAQRNLGEDGRLGGVIFGCTRETIDECLNNLVFGLPRSHWCYVSYIEPGLPVFLFNYNDRLMHGIFRATSSGELEINPHAWTGTEHLKTRFPAQVRVERWKKCQPVHERVFRPLISNCYYNDGEAITRFVFELTSGEATALTTEFEKRKVPAQAPSSRQLAATGVRKPAVAPASSKPAAAPTAPPPGPDEDGWQTVTAKQKGGVKLGLREVVPAPLPAVSAWSKPLNPAALRSAGPASSSAAASAPHSNGTVAPLANGVRPAAPLSTELANSTSFGRPSTPSATTSAIPPAPTLSAASSGSFVSASASANGDSSAVHGFSSAAPPRPLPYQPQQPPQHGGYEPGPPAAAAVVPSWRAVGSQLPSANGVSHVQVPAPDAAAVALTAARNSLAAVGQAAGPAAMHLVAQASESLEALRLEHVAAAAERQRLEAVQEENAQLRQAQTALLGELLSLRTELAAVSHRIGLPMAGPSAALVSVAHRAQELSSGARAASGSSGHPVKQKFEAEDLYLLGGNDGQEWLDVVDVLSPDIRQWRSGASLPSARGYGAAAAIGHHLFMVGGGNGAAWLSTTIMLDPTHGWQQMASMRAVRGSLGAVCRGGRIWAIGGGEPGVSLETVEVYDPTINTWMPGKKMRQKRFIVAAAELGGSIYATGGYDSEQYLATVERFDPREGSWYPVASMLHKRGSHATAACQGKLYAMGGWDSAEFLGTVEVMDPRVNVWQTAPSMAAQRAYSAAATVGGRIFIAGGMNESNQVDGFEVFDPHSLAWTELPVPPEQKRQRPFLAACVLPRQS